MIRLLGKPLYQWDTDRQVEVDPGINEVHFCHGDDTEALPVEVKDGVSLIPNILLQEDLNIRAWGVEYTENGERTVFETRFVVSPRQKPSDYVYTETEIKHYNTLENLIKDVERNSTVTDERIQEIVKDYFANNPSPIITVDSELSDKSTNPVQNKVVTQSFKEVEATIGNIDVLLGTI